MFLVGEFKKKALHLNEFKTFILIQCLQFVEVDPRFSQTTGGVDVKTWGPSPPEMIDLEVKFIS